MNNEFNGTISSIDVLTICWYVVGNTLIFVSARWKVQPTDGRKVWNILNAIIVLLFGCFHVTMPIHPNNSHHHLRLGLELARSRLLFGQQLDHWRCIQEPRKPRQNLDCRGAPYWGVVASFPEKRINLDVKVILFRELCNVNAGGIFPLHSAQNAINTMWP